MEKIIIAVDAGGTKTKVAAINDKKEIVYEVIGGPGSPAVLKEKAISNIFGLVFDVYYNVKHKYEVSLVQMGISGLGVIDDVKTLEDELKEQLNVDVSMESDAVLGLFSIIEDKYNEGILVLSGTGSAQAGFKDGKSIVLGGYGHLLTESGSSYSAVRMLIVNTINRYEECLEISPLSKEFMDLVKLKKVTDFKVFMYANQKNEIAKYSRFINQKALEGNEEAIDILKKCGVAHGLQIVRIYKHLNLTNRAVIGLRGSFIQKAAFVKEELMKTLNEHGYDPLVVSGDEDPIYGAYYMAKRKGKI